MGCVYKISNGTFTYYGSTKNFKQRMRQHKSACNKKNNRCYNVKIYKTIRDNGGWEQFTKEIVEDNIETKQQWKERETYYFRNFRCNMNTHRNMTEEERKENKKNGNKAYCEKNKEQIKGNKKVYREKNKEKIKAKAKVYYQNNKEKINTRQNEKIICDCGKTIKKNYKAKHKRKPIHKNRVIAGIKIVKFLHKFRASVIKD